MSRLLLVLAAVLALASLSLAHARPTVTPTVAAAVRRGILTKHDGPLVEAAQARYVGSLSKLPVAPPATPEPVLTPALWAVANPEAAAAQAAWQAHQAAQAAAAAAAAAPRMWTAADGKTY